MKKTSLILGLIFFSSSYSQNCNDYKYAIIPAEFNFLKGKDQYKLNTISKMYLEKYGFTTYFDTDILPNEVASQNCNKVFVDVVNSSTLFVTKLTIEVKDCKNNILFSSVQGKSREKDFQVAYNQALREAFASFETLNHVYNGKDWNTNASTIQSGSPAITEQKEILKTEQQPTSKNLSETGKLFAKPYGENLIQLLTNDTDVPQLVLTMGKTNNPAIYIVEEAKRQGVVYKKENQWIFDYYENEKLVSQKLMIINLN